MMQRSLVTMIFLMYFAAMACAQETHTQASTMLVVVGAGGNAEYTQTFSGWADRWQAAAEASDIEYHEIGRAGDKNDREQFKDFVEQNTAASTNPLWLILLGHGTFDRNTAKFNLRGPDVSSKDLKAWLNDIQRPLIVVNSFSCSGAFLKDLQAGNRVVITATNSGAELNYSRFGEYLSDSLDDTAADLDHDDQVSLLEAFLLASSKVQRFYESESRLATEHSLLDDNQDGKGTPADFFVGIRAERKTKGGAKPDGRLAHRYILVPSKDTAKLTQTQISERDRLESEIDAWRDRKSTLSEDEYYGRLENLMLQFAKLYEDASSNADSSRL